MKLKDLLVVRKDIFSKIDDRVGGAWRKKKNEKVETECDVCYLNLCEKNGEFWVYCDRKVLQREGPSDAFTTI